MKKALFFSVLTLGLVFASVAAYAVDQAATLPLSESIAIAEGALTQAGVSPGAYWLYSITYNRSEKGYYWYYTYRPLPPGTGNQIYVKVYMDKTTDVSGAASR